MTLQCNAQWIKLQVKDQGKGIRLAEQGQVFGASYRASNVQNLQGAGLGLTMFTANFSKALKPQ